jgi:hypothetical protein
MASVHTQEELLKTVQRVKGWSRQDSYAYAFGILGGLADEDKVLRMIDYLNTEHEKGSGRY